MKSGKNVPAEKDEVNPEVKNWQTNNQKRIDETISSAIASVADPTFYQTILKTVGEKMEYMESKPVTNPVDNT